MTSDSSNQESSLNWFRTDSFFKKNMARKKLLELSKVCHIYVDEMTIRIKPETEVEFGPIPFSDYRKIIKMRTGNEVGDVVAFGSDGVTFYIKF